MTNLQLLKAIAASTGQSESEVALTLRGLTVVAHKELATPDNDIFLVGLGKIRSKFKAAREVTMFGVTKAMPDRNVITFSVSSALKDAVNL